MCSHVAREVGLPLPSGDLMSNAVDESWTTAIGLWTDAKEMLAADYAALQCDLEPSQHTSRPAGARLA